MKTPSLQKKIAGAWITNNEKNGDHMDLTDIAKAVYGDYLFESMKSKNNQTAKEALLDSIQNNIQHAKSLSNDHGYLISVKRKPTLNDPTKKHIIEGWRIFVPGEDEMYLVDELNYKKKHAEARVKSFNMLKEVVEDKRLLEPEKIKQISM